LKVSKSVGRTNFASGLDYHLSLTLYLILMIFLSSLADYVAYVGRHCAIDYPSFEKYMKQILDSVMSAEPAEYIDIDMAIDDCVDGIGMYYLYEAFQDGGLLLSPKSECKKLP
jgi:hypothetical protein